MAKDIGYIDEVEFSKIFDVCDKCSRQISRFMQYLAHQPNSIREEGIYYNV